jgi:GntR family phosphonate transport system transcriptional regulator
MTEEAEHQRRTPNYQQISDRLRTEIQREYTFGDLLPGEQTLAERFHVNRHTVRRAIEELMAQGLVVRHHGRRPMVSAHPVRYVIDPSKGATASLFETGVALETQLLDLIVDRVEEEVAHDLSMRKGQRVVQAELLRCVGDAPLSLATVYLAASRWERAMRRYQGGSLHAHLAAETGIHLERGYSALSARLPSPADAQVLQIGPQCPILRVRSLSRDSETGQPVELSLTRVRGDSLEAVIPFHERDQNKVQTKRV